MSDLITRLSKLKELPLRKLLHSFRQRYISDRHRFQLDLHQNRSGLYL